MVCKLILRRLGAILSRIQIKKKANGFEDIN